MAIEVTIPRLGWSMEEGVFVRWLDAEGQWVNRRRSALPARKRKSHARDRIARRGFRAFRPAAHAPAKPVLVGQVIAYLAAKDETLAIDSPSKTPSPAAIPAPAHDGPMSGDAERRPAGPAARCLARQLNVAIENVAGSGRGGRITADDIHAEAGRRTRKPAGALAKSPAARRTAPTASRRTAPMALRRTAPVHHNRGHGPRHRFARARRVAS